LPTFKVFETSDFHFALIAFIVLIAFVAFVAFIALVTLDARRFKVLCSMFELHTVTVTVTVTASLSLRGLRFCVRKMVTTGRSEK